MIRVWPDTETTGVAHDDHIWEFAAIRGDDEDNLIRFHAFVQHDLEKAKALPDKFRDDHDVRYDPDQAITPRELASVLQTVFQGRPQVIGAVPNFDTERFGRLLRHFGVDDHPWHHRLRDVETMAESFLRGRASLGDETARAALEAAGTEPDALSRACGVEPPGAGLRHTAMGDVEWAYSLWSAITSGRIVAQAEAVSA